jgi:hypothetical protein
MIVQDFLTHRSELDESSGYSLAGSFTQDLIASKVWLLQHLEKIRHNYSTMYVLGSWYGNLALYLKLQPVIQVDLVINVEIDKKMLDTSKSILDFAGVENVEYMLTDANQLDYRQLGRAGVVVNTSLTETPETGWFKHIPAGTLVAMQARNRDPGVTYRSYQDIQRRYPLTKILYHGQIQLRDPETQYRRYMVIGTK